MSVFTPDHVVPTLRDSSLVKALLFEKVEEDEDDDSQIISSEAKTMGKLVSLYVNGGWQDKYS